MIDVIIRIDSPKGGLVVTSYSKGRGPSPQEAQTEYEIRQLLTRYLEGEFAFSTHGRLVPPKE